jgi:DNA-binding beta-propeller fold protein YncE
LNRSLGVSLLAGAISICALGLAASAEAGWEATQRIAPPLHEGQYVSDLAVGPDGDLFLTATAIGSTEDEVIKLAPSGQVLARWGSPGSAPGEFSDPVGVAVGPGGQVYVADTENDRVQKFDADGNLLTAWGSTGHEPGQFDQPVAVATAPNGDVYVADLVSGTGHRVQRFDSDGTFITEWRVDGFPSSLAIGPDGAIFAGAVSRFDSDGKLLNRWAPELPSTLDLATDRGGRIYVSGYYSFHGFTQTEAAIYLADGRRVGQVGCIDDAPGQIAVAPDQAVYAVNAQITRFEFRRAAESQCVITYVKVPGRLRRQPASVEIRLRCELAECSVALRGRIRVAGLTTRLRNKEVTLPEDLRSSVQVGLPRKMSAKRVANRLEYRDGKVRVVLDALNADGDTETQVITRQLRG